MLKVGEFKRNKYKFATMSVLAEKGKEIEELRAKEISIFTKELYLYKVLLRDLVNHFPTQKDRNLILNVAYYIVEEIEIFDRFQKRRELPLGRLSKETRISRSFLESWQDYIIAYVLIISNHNFTYMQNYIKVELNENEENKVVPMNDKSEISHRGIVIGSSKKSTIILTSSGQFVRIRKSEKVELGQETHGLEKKGIFHYKFQIVIGILFIVLLCAAAYRSYTKVSSTVVFNCTSQIKMDVNRGNKVIYTHTASDKGKKMLEEINPLDRDIDDCLKDLIEYAKENDMTPKDGFLIVVTGKPLKYGDLDKTDEYIVENKIDIQINNGGGLHNSYESVKIKKNEGE